MEHDRTIITQPRQIIWLREIDAETDNSCWVVCANGDPGAVAFVPLAVSNGDQGGAA